VTSRIRIITAALIAILAIATVATANKRRTALYGPHLPTRALVNAWSPSNTAMIQQMRDYVKEFDR
jgi:hypothetical protein